MERTGGFSLVELLVVMGIIGILAGAAAVSLRGLRSPALAGAAGEVASAMKWTRQAAISAGRPMYFVIATTNAATNLGATVFRSYAVLEEIRVGEETQEEPFFTNNTANSIFLPRMEWRQLPEGVVFCNVATWNYSTIAGDPFDGATLGVPQRREHGASSAGTEWRFFTSTNQFDIRSPFNPGNNPQRILLTYIGFNSQGQAFSSDRANVVAVRLAAGVILDNQIALTDTNNYYYVESDPVVGRIRVRSRDSFRH